jgi:class 3 adenylate cyclase
MAGFCHSCGAALPDAAAAPAVEQTRRVVTAFFCDVEGSTALGERLDPEAVRGVMNRYFAAVSGALERHGGTVEKFIGDAVMARCHDRRSGGRRPGVAADSGDRGHRQRRRAPEAAASAGEILIGESTYALVRDAVLAEPAPPLALKGKSRPVAAYRLEAVRPGAVAGRERRRDVPLIGREREATLLRQAFDRIVSESSCHLFRLLGTAGVGKSRLSRAARGPSHPS